MVRFIEMIWCTFTQKIIQIIEFDTALVGGDKFPKCPILKFFEKFLEIQNWISRKVSNWMICNFQDTID